MIARDEYELFEAAAGAIAHALASVADHRPIHFMLTGGPTAEGVYEALAERPDMLPQHRLYLYFGDERGVPPDHPASNYGMARDTLLGALDVPGDQVHRIRGELDPSEAAADAERHIRDSVEAPAPRVPALDLVLLGVGDDGHIASLFPGSAALSDNTKLFTEAQNPAGYPRVTATLPLLCAARRIFIMAHGAELAPAIRRALDEPPSPATPASLVCPDRGGAIAYFLDEQAARELSPASRARIAGQHAA